MRIVITADPYLPVPPRWEGGIERMVHLLVRGLARRGHEITLLAHPASRTPARLVPYGAPPHFGPGPRVRELWQVGAQLWNGRASVDVIHSFGRLAALLPVLPLRRLPKIQTYHRVPVPWRGVRRAIRLAGPSLHLTACSASVFRGPSTSTTPGSWRAIHNGIDTDAYHFVARVPPDAPLVFLGRLEPIKGAHHAIAIARGAKRRLLIAGPRTSGGSGSAYFEREIAPAVDGTAVHYAGPVADAEKDRLLGSAAGLLMPAQSEETFGLVIAEAMACGTPVIAFARGGIPEVVADGVSGFLCRTVDEAVGSVARLRELDRARVRAECEARFSHTAMVDAYERLYGEVVRS